MIVDVAAVWIPISGSWVPYFVVLCLSIAVASWGWTAFTKARGFARSRNQSDVTGGRKVSETPEPPAPDLRSLPYGQGKEVEDHD